MNNKMNVFKLDDCGVCSAWHPTVKCSATNKLMKLTITICVYDDTKTYKLDSTGLEEGCVIIDEPIEKTKDEMEKYLEQNFMLIDGLECVPFDPYRNICPSCNDSLEPGLQEC